MGDDIKGIATEKEILHLLYDLHLIDYPNPLWLNLDHADNREYLSEKKFKEYIVPTAELDDISALFIPSSNSRPIPVTNIKLPFVVDNHTLYLNFLASARPASPKELPDFRKKDESKIPPVSELEKRLKNVSHRSMFQPHLQGIWAWSEKNTIFYYPFGQGKNPDALTTIADIALQNTDMDYFVVRNPQVSLRSRTRGALPLLLYYGVLSPSTKYFKNNFLEGERRLDNARLDAARSIKLCFPDAKNVLYKDITKADLKSEDILVSYFPLTINDFGKNIYNADGDEVMSVGETRTLPVALTTSFNGESGLYNYGLFKRFGPSNSALERGEEELNKDVLEVLYWNKPSFAKKVSAQISSVLGLPVKTIYRQAKKGSSSLHIVK